MQYALASDGRSSYPYKTSSSYLSNNCLANARHAGVVQRQNPSLPSWSCGFDSHHPLQITAFTKYAPVAQLDRATAF